MVNIYLDYKLETEDKELARFMRNEISHFAEEMFKRHNVKVHSYRMGSVQVGEENEQSRSA